MGNESDGEKETNGSAREMTSPLLQFCERNARARGRERERELVLCVNKDKSGKGVELCGLWMG